MSLPRQPRHRRAAPGLRAALAAVACLLVATCLQRERTLAIGMVVDDSDTSCLGSCAFDVSCMTHVLVQYEEVDAGDSPVAIGAPSCRKIGTRLKPHETLCHFGSELGTLPNMPTSRPFRVRVEGYVQPAENAADAGCQKPDLMWSSTTGPIDLTSGEAPPGIRLVVGSCHREWCSGVSGVVYDFDSALPADEDMTVDFGYFQILQNPPNLVSTARNGSKATVRKGDLGAFHLESDETLQNDKHTCRPFQVDRGFKTLSCPDATSNPKLPLRDEHVVALSRAFANRLRDAFDKFGAVTSIEDAGFVIGRVTSKGQPVGGAQVVPPGGQCDPSIPAPLKQPDGRCIWYPDENLAGFAGESTNSAGLFISAFRVAMVSGGDAGGDWNATVPTEPSRAFIPARAYFAPGSAFAVEIKENLGTAGGDQDAGASPAPPATSRDK